jgi:hypothetical protein
VKDGLLAVEDRMMKGVMPPVSLDVNQALAVTSQHKSQSHSFHQCLIEFAFNCNPFEEKTRDSAFNLIAPVFTILIQFSGFFILFLLTNFNLPPQFQYLSNTTNKCLHTLSSELGKVEFLS